MLTDKQKAELEAKHGKLKIANLMAEDGGHIQMAFKRPSMTVVDLANKKMMATKNPSDYAKAIIANCCVYGKEHLEEDAVKIALYGKVDEIVNSYDVSFEGN